MDLHPRAAALAKPPVAKLVDWMMKFQFHNDCDYFTIDPVAYAPALGEPGIAAYRSKLAEVESGLGARPTEQTRWTSPHSHDWLTLDLNAQRLAVLDRDVEAIIRTHARDRQGRAWMLDTAEALAEIGEFDLALDWARQALDIGPGHQSLKAGEFWCALARRAPSIRSCQPHGSRCSSAGHQQAPPDGCIATRARRGRRHRDDVMAAARGQSA